MDYQVKLDKQDTSPPEATICSEEFEVQMTPRPDVVHFDKHGRRTRRDVLHLGDSSRCGTHWTSLADLSRCHFDDLVLQTHLDVVPTEDFFGRLI